MVYTLHLIILAAILFQWKWFARDIAKFLDLVESYRNRKEL